VLTLRNDHFIIRDETARKTLAGGVVVHPWARRHKRGEQDLLSRLESLHTGDVTLVTESFLNESGDVALSIEAVQQFLNLQEEVARRHIEAIKHLRTFNADGERLYTTEHKWLALKDKILSTLRGFHKTHALVPGMDMEEVRGKLPYALSPKLFRVIIETLIAEKAIAKEENLLRTADHRVLVGSQEKSLMEKIKKLLGAQPMAPPDPKEIEKQLGVNRNRLNEVVRLLERDGSVVRVATDLYFNASAVAEIKSVLFRFLTEKGEITAASFRDLIGSSRKYTIPLLEYFDREGLTIRIGDVRRLKSPPPAQKHGSAH
jgi:selenocysteine-specific elongation factor